jgi:hypothetical protein
MQTEDLAAVIDKLKTDKHAPCCQCGHCDRPDDTWRNDGLMSEIADKFKGMRPVCRDRVVFD